MDSKEDEVLRRIGVFGRYQLKVIGLVQFVGLFAAWQLLVRRCHFVQLSNLMF